MNAAEHLYSVLGKPRGQLTVHLVDKPGQETEIVVWLRDGYWRDDIPDEFDGYHVSVQKMPSITTFMAFSAY